jgi:hypothetical protein
VRCFIIILLCCLFFGRPGKSQHTRAIVANAADYINTDNRYLIATFETLVEGSLAHKDFYIFTICTYEGRLISIGALRLVWVNQLAVLKTLKV